MVVCIRRAAYGSKVVRTRTHGTGKVEALSAYSRNDENCRVGIGRNAVPLVGGIGRNGGFSRCKAVDDISEAGIVAPTRTRLIIIVVEGLQRGVYFKLRLLQSRVEVGHFAPCDTRTRAAVNEVDRVFAENGNFRFFCERQSPILVFKKNYALFFDFYGKIVGGS